VGLVVGFLFVGELAALWFLECHGDRVGFAFVAEVAERGSVLSDPGHQRGKDLQVFAERGGVAFAAGTHLGSPQGPAVGSGDDLNIPAVVGVLARPPQVHSLRRAWRAAAVGLDERAVDADMCVSSHLRRQQR
jgi:hypothetical protein